MITLQLLGMYPSWVSWTFTIILNLSFYVAMYSLVIFYHVFAKELKPHNPLAKFICIKGIVFFSFWQVQIVSLSFFLVVGGRGFQLIHSIIIIKWKNRNFCSCVHAYMPVYSCLKLHPWSSLLIHVRTLLFVLKPKHIMDKSLIHRKQNSPYKELLDSKALLMCYFKDIQLCFVIDPFNYISSDTECFHHLFYTKVLVNLGGSSPW